MVDVNAPPAGATLAGGFRMEATPPAIKPRPLLERGQRPLKRTVS